MAEVEPPTYRFVRVELGVLVEFLGDTLIEGGNQIEIRHHEADLIRIEDISASFTAFDLS